MLFPDCLKKLDGCCSLTVKEAGLMLFPDWLKKRG
jgi:hypothetical protein